jgi:hypothetical protein
MNVQEVGNELPEIEVPTAIGETEKDRTFGCVGPEDLVENRLQEENAKGVKYADRGQKKNAGLPLQGVR